MNKKSSAPMHWSMEVYDYERKTITDASVGGIDLRKGCWIHCKWCNSTLKTPAFSLTIWKTHQGRRKHLIHGQKFLDDTSQPPFVTCSSQSSAHSSTSSMPGTPRSLLGIQSSQEHESLMLVRRDFHLNKQHQARYERDVTNVINAMTSLVSDQQGDLDTLQLQVDGMTREIEGLKKQVEVLRRNERQRQVRAPQKEVVRSTSCASQRIPASHALNVRSYSGYSPEARLKIPQKVAATKKRKIRLSMTEMDLFEKRFRLT
ncbi:hypothetical protein PC129_g10022 [Phytophthora cactorum]|nr:hypothetical protein Pcac1_g13932 [Phytophthora cactorum]KAG2830389.1 hypothetical protein PC112_g7694 [Phytophthora cactorum]KAG2832811.1 hypothetical protein PC111_g6448 [Phytophthora cactorum]KAG2860682.1 hypothetical protein PC113_g7842 [Phytophthora cactorum]KAG2902402.1 hypothetical protein PC114_g12764 [Phytophthora cactorum]